MPHRTRPWPSASGQLAQDGGGLHMVAYFNSRFLCTEVVWGNRVKCLCIKRLKPTYANSGFQPKLPSCLAEAGSWQTKKGHTQLKCHSLQGVGGERERDREVAINETKVRQAWLQQVAWEGVARVRTLWTRVQVLRALWEMRRTFPQCNSGYWDARGNEGHHKP